MLDHFPEEIRRDILFRLPIKCLVRCTSVSKLWLSIIKSSDFIRAHLKRRHESLLLMHGYTKGEATEEGYCSDDPDFDEYTQEVYCLHYDNSALDEYCRVEIKIDYEVDLINGRFRVAGTCDGLVCLADDILSKSMSYIIWNPSIRKAVMLPWPSVSFTTHGPFEDSIGFGFDAIANDYKVVRLVTPGRLRDTENPTVAEVYSLATGSWRSLGSVAPPCRINGTRPHTFFNGNIHWVVHDFRDGASFYFILAFDLVSESFREILMPNGTEVYNSRVIVTGDRKYLALFVSYKDKNGGSYLDIWIMKEYCQQGSWTKMITYRAPQGLEGRVSPRPFCFRRSGEILLKLERPSFIQSPVLVSLDLVSQQMNNVDMLDCVCYSIDSYEESLVLLDVDGAVSC